MPSSKASSCRKLGAFRVAAASAGMLVALTLAGRARAGGAASPDPTRAMLERLALSIQKTTLENGLRVVMQPDSSSPTVAIAVTYDVGSRSEQKAESGFARLLYKLMFQGSRNVGGGEHAALVRARGGTFDAATSTEQSRYVEVLPSNELALGLWLEADRMSSLELTRQNFENERRALELEPARFERASPSSLGARELNALVFEGTFSYAHSETGSRAELQAARFEALLEFQRRHYVPQNAVLSIVGDFDADQAISLARRYFASAAGRAPLAAPAPAPAEQTTERRRTLSDPSAATPELYLGWAVPPARTAEHRALELATLILADGDGSRLFELLVDARELAASVTVSMGDRRGPNLFSAAVVLSERAKLGAVEKLVEAELERLAQQGPNRAELERAQRRLLTRFGFGLESNRARAIRFGEFELASGDARLLGRELDGYLAVTPKAVADAVRKYLAPSRRSVVQVLPVRTKQKP